MAKRKRTRRKTKGVDVDDVVSMVKPLLTLDPTSVRLLERHFLTAQAEVLKGLLAVINHRLAGHTAAPLERVPVD